MAPDFFKRENEQSAVLVQPQTDQERLEAYKALLACPTCAPWHAGREPCSDICDTRAFYGLYKQQGSSRACQARRFSIHSAHKRPGELKAAAEAFPSPWAGLSGVYHCGFHSKACVVSCLLHMY